MRNCFVPWCDHQCRENPKRMMFNAPKDEKLFQKWSNILPKKRIFKRSDKVCERHFISSDISTTFDHVINGELFKMPRGRPKLNENVTPSRNLPANDEEIQPVKRGRRCGSKKPKSLSVKKQKLENNKDLELTTNDKNNDDNNILVEYLAIENKKENESKKSEELIELSTNDNINNCDSNLTEKNNNDNKSNEIEAHDINFFENIYEDIFEVVLPSTLWGIHRDPNKRFIAFSYYDPKIHTTTKVVELTNTAILKVIMCSKIITVENYYSEITFDAISNILNDTDEAQICKMANENIELCEVKLINTDSNEEYCQICSQLKSC